LFAWFFSIANCFLFFGSEQRALFSNRSHQEKQWLFYRRPNFNVSTPAKVVKISTLLNAVEASRRPPPRSIALPALQPQATCRRSGFPNPIYSNRLDD
jgi:hypothetical protein